MTYFVKDLKKSGGAYTEYKGTLRTFDEAEKTLIFTDGKNISINTIIHITGEIFSDIENRE